MIIDAAPLDAETTARVLESILIAKSLRLSTYERQALTDFLADLQSALDEESERQHYERLNGSL
jgi:hypothetical protein